MVTLGEEGKETLDVGEEVSAGRRGGDHSGLWIEREREIDAKAGKWGYEGQGIRSRNERTGGFQDERQRHQPAERRRRAVRDRSSR
jgi:hypothetical protein